MDKEKRKSVDGKPAHDVKKHKSDKEYEQMIKEYEEAINDLFAAFSALLKAKSDNLNYEAPLGECPGAPEKPDRIEQRATRWKLTKKASTFAILNFIKIADQKITNAALIYAIRIVYRIITAATDLVENPDDEYAAGWLAEAWEGGED